jgi:hypothetical protein
MNVGPKQGKDELPSDNDILQPLIPYEFDFAKGTDEIRSLPLEIVPSGTTKPRGEVFRLLSIKEGKVREFRLGIVSFREVVAFMAWQVSPSYDLVCMTYVKKEDRDVKENPILARFKSAEREVYGVSLMQREEATKLLMGVSHGLVYTEK